MPKMREMRAVDEDYPLVGPNQNTIRQPIEVPAFSLFRCLADGPAWEEWLGLTVEWTTPEPHGVGTTRTVRGTGVKIEEYFFTWVEGELMGFRFARASMPVKAFAERYECIEVDDHACELAWSYAFEWGGALGGVIGKVFGAVFAFKCRRAVRRLAKLLESDPARYA
ncbi:MAG: hypothetical protein HKN44_12285 [Ilumatobacter sp.]|nr:hypothetical protein [Ilumatobacter sp.]